MLSRPLRIFIENEIENVFIDNADLIQEPPVVNIKPIKLTSEQFFSKSHELEKYKIADLRDIIKWYKNNISFHRLSTCTNAEMKKIKVSYDFSMSGKKNDLICRIIRLFWKDRLALLLQKKLRGNFVRQSIKLSGPALLDRSLCVNDTDFFTLEPLKNIPTNLFFSYRGPGDFIYGFDLSSLKELLKNNKAQKIKNPYNRESMEKIVPDIFSLSRLNNIINNSHNKKITPVTPNHVPKSATYNISSNNINANIRINAMQYDPTEIINKMNGIRLKPVHDRIRDLFMEIDQIGFYTQPHWFEGLEKPQYIRFCRCLYDIWNFRAQMSFNVKLKICPLYDPFINITNNILYFNNLSTDEIRQRSLDIMEDMIFTGIDAEHRSLGAFHLLSALTIVSLDARENMPWLYESVMF